MGKWRRLRINQVKDQGLVHRSWYAVRSDDLSFVDLVFSVPCVLQIGDADANGRVNNGDANMVNGGIPCASCPDDRRDMDGNNRINNGDTNIVNGHIPSAMVHKPSGHGPCEQPL
jgi:hypothetical protein